MKTELLICAIEINVVIIIIIIIIMYRVSPLFFLSSFHSLSSVSGMSCAGTLGTCTHGTGIDYGLIANFVSLQQRPKKKKKHLTEHLAKCDCAIMLYQPTVVLQYFALFVFFHTFPLFSCLFAEKSHKLQNRHWKLLINFDGLCVCKMM